MGNGPWVDLDLRVVAWIKNKGLEAAYKAGMEACPIWKDLYKESHQSNIRRNGNFLYGFREFGNWRLILPTVFKFKGEDFLQILINQKHEAMGHGGVEKTYKAFSDKYELRGATEIIKTFVGTCQIC